MTHYSDIEHHLWPLLLYTETYIFYISPKKDETSLLASPGWPGGMKAFSTASWIVTFPERLEAQLTFTQVRQPKCTTRHTSIQVQTLGSEEEMYSRREDEEGDSEIVIPASFYLNMSNCLPKRDSFSVLAEVTLRRQRSMTSCLHSFANASWYNCLWWLYKGESWL